MRLMIVALGAIGFALAIGDGFAVMPMFIADSNSLPAVAVLLSCILLGCAGALLILFATLSTDEEINGKPKQT